jgi:TolB-like protein
MAEGGGEQKASVSAPAVFISYASQDAAVAERLCAALEAAGFPCWIAPRDVKPGAVYADAIVRAIGGAQAVVLVLSENSVASSHVGKEVERASSKRRPIIALRIDEAPLSPALEYFLGESQWIDARAGRIDAALAKLIAAIRDVPRDAAAISPPVTSGTPTVKAPAASSEMLRNRLVLTVLLAAVAVALAWLLADKFWISKHASQEKPGATASPGVRASSAVSEKSIAVLPFVDMSENKDQGYFADGMAEEILDLLAKIPGLRVIGRTSSFQFKGKNVDLREIGKSLGAAYLLEGSVRRSQDRIRVTAQLIASRDGAHRWSESYDRPIGDAIKVQDDIAAGLARAIQVAVGTADPVAREADINPAAYDLYLRARAARDRSDAQGTRESIRYYEQALKIAPTFAEAALGLASVLTQYVASGEGGADTDARTATEEVAARAHAAIEAAFQLNPNAPSLYGMRAVIDAFQDLDFRAAEAEIDKAIQIAPPDDSDTQWYVGILECTLGRWEAGLDHKRVALEQDPLNPRKHASYAQSLIRAGHPEEAEQQARRALAISPTEDWAGIWLGYAALAGGEFSVAFDAFNKLPSTSEDIKLAGLAAVYHAMGRAKDSDRAMRQLETTMAITDPYLIAQAHANKGELDAALPWLNRAADAKDGWIASFAKGDPAFNRYKSDPRYRAWLRKVNLPE